MQHYGERIRFDVASFWTCDRCGEPVFARVYQGYIGPRTRAVFDALDRAESWVRGLFGR